jgi:hypothetical protein
MRFILLSSCQHQDNQLHTLLSSSSEESSSSFTSSQFSVQSSAVGDDATGDTGYTREVGAVGDAGANGEASPTGVALIMYVSQRLTIDIQNHSTICVSYYGY